MPKARKDNKGRALLKGESQRTQDNRYVYTYTNPEGKRKYIYATTLQELREKEKLVIEGAAHAEAVSLNPNLYWKTIDEFIQKNTN